MPHRFRHTFGADMRARASACRSLQQMMGHADLENNDAVRPLVDGLTLPKNFRRATASSTVATNANGIMAAPTPTCTLTPFATEYLKFSAARETSSGSSNLWLKASFRRFVSSTPRK